MNKKLYITILIGFLWLNMSESLAGTPCLENIRVIEPCYSVRALLTVFANSLPRLIVFKTNRILRIGLSIDYYTGDFVWPDEINKLVDPDTDVYGTYLVCPFTKQEPGRMQTVCIAKVSNFYTRPAVERKTELKTRLNQ